MRRYATCFILLPLIALFIYPIAARAEAVIPDRQQLGLTGQILETQIVLAEMPFQLMMRTSSDYVNILNDFDRTIDSMRRDGTLRAILNRYR